MGLEGPRYRTAIQAVSDELLLDQLLMPPSTGSNGRNGRSADDVPGNSHRLHGAFDSGLTLECAGE